MSDNMGALIRNIMDAEDELQFRAIYERIGRAMYAHHEATGIQMKPGLWKIYVSPEMGNALTIFARRRRKASTALEINSVLPDGSLARLGGFDILVDEKLTGDLILLRTETWA